MKIVVIIVALIVVVAVSVILYVKYQIDNTPNNMNLEASIDSEVRKLKLHDQSNTIVIGIYKGGRSYIKSYGNGDSDETGIFQVGSLSKVFTASLLQILSDEGVVQMDATLGELIGDKVSLSLAAEKVTLRQLVTHTSGFPSVPKSLEAEVIKRTGKESLMIDPYSHFGPESVFSYLATTEGKGKTGKFEYSNYGMGLLAHVLEMITNKGYESLVVEKLFTPLGMNETRITLTPEMKSLLAQGYNDEGEPVPIWTFTALAGAGAFNSSISDMLQFIRANVEGEVLTSNSLQKMWKPQFKGDTGIGWMLPTLLDKFFGNKEIVWHNGMVGGYASYLSIDVKSKSGVVVLTNRSIDVTMLGMMLSRQVRTQSWSSS